MKHKPQYLAKQGDMITCTNGHPIAFFVRNVAIGDDFVPTHISGWQQPEPQTGDAFPLCIKCGGKFWHGEQGQHFHFKEGWRNQPPAGSKNTWREKLAKVLRIPR